MKVGLQLFSVKESMSLDPEATFKRIAELGYRYIEPYASPIAGDESSFGLRMSLKKAKALLSDLGLQVVGAHYYPLASEGFDDFCKYYRALGAKQVGCGGAHFPRGRKDVLLKCELMTDDAEIARHNGLKYYYHNHYREYQMFEGEQVIQTIMNNTPTDLVHYEIDTFWAARGGVDPVEEMLRWKNRLIPLIHQKDFSRTARVPLNIWDYTRQDFPITAAFDGTTRLPEIYTEVGEGILPIQDYIEAANKVGVEYILLEQDKSEIGEMESIEASMNAFKKFHGVEWN